MKGSYLILGLMELDLDLDISISGQGITTGKGYCHTLARWKIKGPSLILWADGIRAFRP